MTQSLSNFSFIFSYSRDSYPTARSACFARPSAPGLRGSTQNAMRTNSSVSFVPLSRLHFPQLGAVQRCTFAGVESGYHERGNTWSMVVSSSFSRQWIHRPSLLGRFNMSCQRGAYRTTKNFDVVDILQTKVAKVSHRPEVPSTIYLTL